MTFGLRLPASAVLAALVQLVVACVGASTAAAVERAELPILRPTADYPRIYVQVELPDGKLGLFLVDTGADISVLSRETADRLGLHVDERYSRLEGLSGPTWMDRAVIPTVALGSGDARFVVPDVEVAVGVRGMSDTVQFMPLDGLLGNNVWSRFVLDIDYARNLIVLHEPDGVRRTRVHTARGWASDREQRSAPMLFDGQHVYSPVTLTTKVEGGHTATIVAQIDTGAGDLTLCAATGAPFEQDTTEGLESVRGIGASETLPPHRFLEMTRRIPLEEVTIGGARFDVHASARWLLFDRTDISTCGTGMRALLGHEYLAPHRVVFDYGNQRIAVIQGRKRTAPVNGHQVLLDQDLETYGPDRPDRALIRAKLEIGAGDEESAVALLNALPSDLPAEQAAEARVLLARLQRLRGDLPAAWEAIEPLRPGELVEQGEIVAAVNGLLFEEKVDQAAALAEQAVAEAPDKGDAWVARADVRLFTGDADGAGADLAEAGRLEEYPDAHLLRRARVALARGDRFASMSHVRKLLRLYPFGGEFLWFYAMLVEDPLEADTFRADMTEAMGRLHPDMRPVDFQVAAHHTLGDQDRAEALMQEGIDAMCTLAPDPSSDFDNCIAWFYALAGVRTDEALRRVDRALAETGPRSDYLDTKAMVHLARGELEQAATAAWSAARLSPEDVYMLWQAERIRDLLGDDRQARVTPSAPPSPGASK